MYSTSNAHIIFTGKDDSLELNGKGLGHAVVLKLLEGLEDRGHHVYLDNWYSSPALFDDLHSKGFGACGTLRLNRKGLPQIIKSKRKMKKHTMVSGTTGKSLAMVWMDKRAVAMLSTIHDDSMVPISRRSGEATGGVEIVSKPLCIDQYNHFMNGVDRHDQLTSYYGFSHRSKKWWKRGFFHLIEMAIVNAYILYALHTKQVKQKPLTHQRFRIELAQQLLVDAGAAHTPPNEHVQSGPHKCGLPTAARLTERHFIAMYDSNPTGKREQHTVTVLCVLTERGRDARQHPTNASNAIYPCAWFHALNYTTQRWTRNATYNVTLYTVKIDIIMSYGCAIYIPYLIRTDNDDAA